MSARERLLAVLRDPTSECLCGDDCPTAESLLDAYRAEVLAEAREARTTWPSAAELQQAANTKRATGTPEDAALADWLDATANALAWLAPYRPHEGGYEMWGAVSAYAQLVNSNGDQPAPDFFQPGHSYTHRDGSTFRCVAVTTHPDSGKLVALGWHTDTADWTFVGVRNIDHWNHEYDGCQPPPGPDAAYQGTRGEPGEGV